ARCGRAMRRSACATSRAPREKREDSLHPDLSGRSHWAAFRSSLTSGGHELHGLALGLAGRVRAGCPVGQAEDRFEEGGAPPAVATDDAAESVGAATGQVVCGRPAVPLIALDRDGRRADL